MLYADAGLYLAWTRDPLMLSFYTFGALMLSRLAEPTPLDSKPPLWMPREKRNEASTPLVQRIKAARSIVDELEAAGVTGWQRSGKNLVACCVFHKDVSPSLWVNPASGLRGCNAVSCPVHDGRQAHDVINARALWRGISEQEAIKQLADELSPKPRSTDGA